jgi:hypothetical protein
MQDILVIVAIALVTGLVFTIPLRFFYRGRRASFNFGGIKREIIWSAARVTIGGIVWGLGFAVIQASKGVEEKILRENLAATVEVVDASVCSGMDSALLVRITNRFQDRTLMKIEFSLSAFQKGRSTQLLDYNFRYLKYDFITKPGETTGGCWPFPADLRGIDSELEIDLVYSEAKFEKR